MIKIHPIHAFNDNYIWIINNQTHAAVVDPGDAFPVAQYLDDNNLQLVAILITHHHNDHVGGNTALLKKFSVPVYGPANESIATLTHHISEGEKVQIDELSLCLSVLDVPGHTAGHIAYYSNDNNVLFCGDTLFVCGCGRIFEGIAPQMYASLQKLASLPEETLVYCTHEYTLSNINFSRTVDPNNTTLKELEIKMQDLRHRGIPTLPSSIATERTNNPFLRCDQPEIILSVSNHVGKTLLEPVEVFTALRQWKNTF